MQTTLNFASKSTEDTGGESDRQLQDSDKSDDEINEFSVDNSTSGGVKVVTSSSDTSKHLPTCWSQKMWLNKIKLHPCLICSDSKLGCSTCKELPSLGVDAAKNIHFSQEWQSAIVSASGKTKEKQFMSLRNNIRKHSKSKAHIKAEKIKLQANKEIIENSIAILKKSHLSVTENLFWIAYKIVKTVTLLLIYLLTVTFIFLIELTLDEHCKVISLVTKFVIILVMKCEQEFAKKLLKVEVNSLF